MPHTTFRCPDPVQWGYDEAADTFDPDVPIAKCLQCSLTRPNRACHWDYADLALRVDRPSNYCSFTPSKFNGCDREQWLKPRVDYTVHPGDRNALARGTALHTGLELVNLERSLVLSEVTVVRYFPVDDKFTPIVVRPDKVYPEAGVIHDDKTAGYLPVEGGQPKPFIVYDSYVKQLSVGAWAWANPTFAIYQDRTTVSAPEAIAITQGEITKRGGSGNQVRQMVPLMEHGALEEWITMRVRDLRRMYSGEEPGFLPEDARQFCGSCAVRVQCGVPLVTKSRKPKRS